jgi:MoaA/NifB/PqqE/SkfB family radical SAM enzyme
MDYESYGYDGGTFSAEEIDNARKHNIPLTLDLAIPCNCLNNCYYCGYRYTQKGKGLSYEEIIDIADQFKKICGKSIKILGEGEPLLRKDILNILGYIYRIGLKPVLFTCGDVIGDDALAQEIHGIGGEDIVERLKGYNVTVMLKYDKKNQNRMCKRKGYSEKRQRALKLLLKAGFNEYIPSHLGFGIVVLKDNYREIHKNYDTALKNNIYSLLCPLMPIGKVKDKKWRDKVGISSNQMIGLALTLYNIAGVYGIDFPEPADFPGGKPCDISRSGFYIGDTGDIYLCESEEKVGNVRSISLQDT